MLKAGIEGDYIGKRNRDAVYSAYNTLLRKKPKSIQLVRKPNDLTQIKTQNREHESISVLGLKNDYSVFYSSDYKNEIVISDTLVALEEVIQDDTLPKYATPDSINKFLF